MQPTSAGAQPGKQKWTVEIEVADDWVADGFDLTGRRMHDIMTDALPFAAGHEIVCKVVAAPDPDTVAQLQGYASAEMRQRALTPQPAPSSTKYVIKARRPTGFCYLADGPHGVVERTRHEQTVYLTPDVTKARTWTDVALAERVAATLKGSAGVETLPESPPADPSWGDDELPGNARGEDLARGT